MITVTLLYRDQCPECDQALADLKSLAQVVPHNLELINVDLDPKLRGETGLILPIVEIGPYRLRPPFTRQDLQIILSAARDRVDQMERVDQSVDQQRLLQGVKLNTSDRITHFMSHHYLAIVNLLLVLYVGLPFLAPVLQKAGSTLPASIIYKIYSPMCHQLAFRSWFLFGEQAYYPRALAGIEGVTPYEALTNSTEVDLFEAREFVGNPTVGYKVALCQRDVAIYLFMLLFSLAFWATGRRLTSIPWYIWVVVGLGPIGLDGFSQLPSLAGSLPGWLPFRESSPLLRTLTGGLFGWMTAWYLFPMLEETARETSRIVHRKMDIVRRANTAERP